MNPNIRIESSIAIQELAKELKLPYDDNMQDWAYEVANAKSVEAYINHYILLNDDDKKFILMQMIIQAVNDQESIQQLEFYWNTIKELLMNDFGIHKFTMYYWCCFNNENIEDKWTISPYMENLWAEAKIL